MRGLLASSKVWQKRFKGTVPRDLKTRAQQMRFLQYRGFTPEQIKLLFFDSDTKCMRKNNNRKSSKRERNSQRIFKLFS